MAQNQQKLVSAFFVLVFLCFNVAAVVHLAPHRALLPVRACEFFSECLDWVGVGEGFRGQCLTAKAFTMLKQLAEGQVFHNSVQKEKAVH